MRIRYGNIWDFFPAEYVVIPVNIGWRSDGSNVMGAGLAKEAASRFPDLPAWWGWWCRSLGSDTPVMVHSSHRVILFPTKPLNETKPHLSWQQESDLQLIWRSAAQLAAVTVPEPITLPLVGCGNGRLNPDMVLPVLKTFLSHDRFTLVSAVQHKPVIDGVIFGQWGNWLVPDDPRPGRDGRPLQSHFVREFS